MQTYLYAHMGIHAHIHALSTQFENCIATFSENSQKQARASKVGKLARWDHQTTFKNFGPELFLSKRNSRTKKEKRLKVMPPNDWLNMGFIQTLSLLLMPFCACRRESSMAAL